MIAWLIFSALFVATSGSPLHDHQEPEVPGDFAVPVRELARCGCCCDFKGVFYLCGSDKLIQDGPNNYLKCIQPPVQANPTSSPGSNGGVDKHKHTHPPHQANTTSPPPGSKGIVVKHDTARDVIIPDEGVVAARHKESMEEDPLPDEGIIGVVHTESNEGNASNKKSVYNRESLHNISTKPAFGQDEKKNLIEADTLHLEEEIRQEKKQFIEEFLEKTNHSQPELVNHDGVGAKSHFRYDELAKDRTKKEKVKRDGEKEKEKYENNNVKVVQENTDEEKTDETQANKENAKAHYHYVELAEEKETKYEQNKEKEKENNEKEKVVKENEDLDKLEQGKTNEENGQARYNYDELAEEEKKKYEKAKQIEEEKEQNEKENEYQNENNSEEVEENMDIEITDKEYAHDEKLEKDEIMTETTADEDVENTDSEYMKETTQQNVVDNSLKDENLVEVEHVAVEKVDEQKVAEQKVAEQKVAEQKVDEEKAEHEHSTVDKVRVPLVDKENAGGKLMEEENKHEHMIAEEELDKETVDTASPGNENEDIINKQHRYEMERLQLDKDIRKDRQNFINEFLEKTDHDAPNVALFGHAGANAQSHFSYKD